MTIRFENTMQDALAYNEYCNFHTPQLRRRYRRMRVLGPLMIVALSASLSRILLGHPLEAWAWMVILLGAAGYFCFQPLLWRRLIRRQVRLLTQVGAYKGFLGDHMVTISPDGLRSISPVGEALYRWDSITSVVKTETHLFLFMSETMGGIVPRRAFADAAHEAAFLAEVERYRAVSSFRAGVPVAVAVPATVATAAPQTSNAPWWSGQTAATLDAETQTNAARRNG